jgi:hypothetical protein
MNPSFERESVKRAYPIQVSEPTPIELLEQLREVMGLPNYARTDSPKTVWEETLAECARIRKIATSGYCYRCEERAKAWER